MFTTPFGAEGGGGVGGGGVRRRLGWGKAPTPRECGARWPYCKMQQHLRLLLEPLQCAFHLQNAYGDPDSAATGGCLNGKFCATIWQRIGSSTSAGHGDAVSRTMAANLTPGAHRVQTLQPKHSSNEPSKAPSSCTDADPFECTALGPDGNVTQCLLEHFKKMQAVNPSFCYAIQLDHRSNCVIDFLCVDASARLLYKWFGDAVVLDITCNCKRNLPAVPYICGANWIEP
jgi:hypothetical protein